MERSRRGFIRPARFGAIVAAALVLIAASPEARSLARKFALIESERLPSGARVVTTAAEWNAWVREEATTLGSGAIRDTRVSADSGNRVIAFARIDFLKLSQSAGKSTNWLMQQMLQGEKPVTVTVHVLSHDGQARVDVERVEVQGVALQGAALDFLIQQYVIPNFPDAQVSRWFSLDHRMDHFEITAAGVTIVVR